MKILILGGVHGNELLGIKLVKYLQANPIKGVDALIANPKAVERNIRFTEADLNRSFGCKNVNNYELKVAYKLAKVFKKYDCVLDFHNTQSVNNDCLFIGKNASSQLKDFLPKLKLTRCVIATYNCLNKVAGNAVSIEISESSNLNGVSYWYKTIQNITNKEINNSNTIKIKYYRYIKRLTWQQKSKYNLNLQTFKPLSIKEKQLLNLSGIIVPIFVNSKLTEYYATLLKKESK
jgi:hypothetical protein